MPASHTRAAALMANHTGWWKRGVLNAASQMAKVTLATRSAAGLRLAFPIGELTSFISDTSWLR